MEPSDRSLRLLVPAAALVSACAPRTGIPRLEPTGEGRATIVRERVQMACREATREEVARIHPSLPPRLHAARCDFDTTVLVRNDTAAPRTLSVTATWSDAEGVVASLDDRATATVDGDTSLGPLPVVLAPYESRSLRMRGTALPGMDGLFERAAIRAVEARHFIVGENGGPWSYTFELPSRLEVVTLEAPLELSVRYPASWALSTSGRQVAVAREAETTVELYQGRAGRRESGGFQVPASPAHPGGPLLGLGVAGDTAGAAPRFLTSVGYEVGLFDWTLASLRFDTDFKRRAVIAPVVEVASPYLRAFAAPHAPRMPSIGLGLGAPLWMRDGAAAGLRGQVTLSFPALGVVSYADWFPALGRTDLVLMVQASL